MKKITRKPDVVWREEEGARDEVVKALERGEDATGEGTVLLIVAGMLHQLNFLGGEIWKRLDGTRDADDIVDELMEMFDADREVIAADVRAFLEDLDFRGWITHE